MTSTNIPVAFPPFSMIPCIYGLSLGSICDIFVADPLAVFGDPFWPFSETLDENWLSWKSLSSGPEALHANSLCKIITKDSIGVLISWILMLGVTKT